jgi:hypothetical protein
MSAIHIDQLPEDLQKRLIHLKHELNAPTWTAFLYDVVERLEQLTDNESEQAKGCQGCWYFGRWRTGDRLCNKTGELLDYAAYTAGCHERIEEPPLIFDSALPLSNLAERLGVSLDELRKYIDSEKRTSQGIDESIS